jgi:hypothetical protein
MLMSDRGFPFEEITPDTAQKVRAFCGVEPPEQKITEPEYARQFLQLSGHNFAFSARQPLMENFYVLLRKRALRVIGDSCWEAERAYNRGLFFYSGVVSVATEAAVLPFNEQVILRLQDEDPRMLAGESLTAIQHEAKGFCDLLEDARAGLETEDEQMHRLALIGAGTMHVLLTETIRETTSTDVTALEALHPELADIAWPDAL